MKLKKVSGIVSLVFGAFFFFTLFIWAPSTVITQQTLKWIVGGFGCLFVVIGLYIISCAIKEEQDDASMYQIKTELITIRKSVEDGKR